jgi:hypothetical protein
MTPIHMPEFVHRGYDVDQPFACKACRIKARERKSLARR